ncbi:ADP-ribosylglycohydrolase family protein [Microseira wollei]|uniref:ADP-ribosylation/Crystallin J1 n=1 Tax=Microseira wollei NIES-4236 TaxID=2530354 RepID=A0AAV3X112_9CYAN|nr:ADP-ribosylglycohydrolase family protein [Microseira wollei]GET35583.1 ADP-ribosylation/Crystallin J1 [Microseira wollei NIES-4236]
MGDRTCESIVGCLVGTAVGDGFGLLYQGLSKRQLVRVYPHLNQSQFLFGRGMIYDDTEYTCTVAKLLIVSAGNVDIFKQDLGIRLRFW